MAWHACRKAGLAASLDGAAGVDARMHVGHAVSAGDLAVERERHMNDRVGVLAAQHDSVADPLDEFEAPLPCEREASVANRMAISAATASPSRSVSAE